MIVPHVRSAYERICIRGMRMHALASQFYLPAWRDHLELQSFLRRQERRLQGLEVRRTHPDRWRVAVVIPWFGKDISGGAENAAYGLVSALADYAPDIDVEVLTSTLPEFAQDWNRPTYVEGLNEEEGMAVRRFHPTTHDRTVFDFINGTFLMPGGTAPLLSSDGSYRSPLPACLESFYLKRMVSCPGLIAHIEQNWDAYDAFAFIPYMFATTVLGCAVAGPKAMLIPCQHDERYAYMKLYSRVFSNVGAVLCHVRSESALFRRLYPDAPEPRALGVQVDTTVASGNAERFREKYGIKGPFILYAGRQVSGKNVPLLIEYFREFRRNHPDWADLHLVLVGKGDLDYSKEPGVRTLGFIPPQDKIDAYRAATALIMLSVNESFSIVLMESWLQETPVVVSAACDVTRDHVEDSGGGVAVADSGSFAAAILHWLKHPDEASHCGKRGRDYVLEHYTAERIAMNFKTALFDTMATE